MQRKTRFYRIQLLAYDLVNAPLWSLPLIGPSPTPMPLEEDSPHIMPVTLSAAKGLARPGLFLRKIQLVHVLPTSDRLN